MALELIKLNDTTLPAIANAIRAKTGDSGLLLPSQMAEAIAGIPTGVTLPALSDPAAVGHVLAGKEYIGADGTKKTGTLVVCDTVDATEGGIGESGIGVNVELESSADGSLKLLTLPEENLTAENIKSGVSIFGVAGTLEAGSSKSVKFTSINETKSVSVDSGGYIKIDVSSAVVAEYPNIIYAEGTTSNGDTVRLVRTGDDNFYGSEYVSSVQGFRNTSMYIIGTMNADGSKSWKWLIDPHGVGPATITIKTIVMGA